MRRAHGVAFLLALLLAGLAPRPAAAQGFSQVGFTNFTANVAITTTSEISVVSSPPVTLPRDTGSVCILAWVQLTTGTMTTTVTPRIRRETTTGGTLVGEANAVTIGAAAGQTEQFYEMVCEDRANVATVTYNFTVQQAAANADGSALQGGILVFVR